MSAGRSLFVCAGCGFRTRSAEHFGSYLVCTICDWEDDAVQLANPTSGGGANQDSLAEHQRRVGERIAPAAIHVGYERDPAWRPLSEREVREAEDLRKRLGRWNQMEVVSVEEAYWAARSLHDG